MTHTSASWQDASPAVAQVSCGCTTVIALANEEDVLKCRCCTGTMGLVLRWQSL